MKLEELKAEDFEQLKAVADGFCPDPSSSVAIVMKHEGNIVGRICAVCPVHIEAPWVAPEYRKGSMFGWLVAAIESRVRSAGVKRVLAYGATEEMNDYIERLGYKRTNLTVWEKEFA